MRLKQNGKELSRFDPPRRAQPRTARFDGVPVGLTVSPDGTKVAYTFYRPTVPSGSPAARASITTYSYADRATRSRLRPALQPPRRPSG